MSEIDVQNAKQIRDPMTVLITMEVPDDEVTLTYSGYSTAKVADGSLGNVWPMRLLADLKGDGFPLNGNPVVYNPSTSASETNGKIGVRSNIGQAVAVTVTGNKSIASLSIFVTGATSVTYNGTTTAIVGGQAVIPVGARSITLTFNPSSATDRIEVSGIVAGTTLRITNDTLIKATVSLRSDLSLVNPTLPESELNVEVYNDADISEIVAGLPEDTPITYQAGYEGDMSPIRKFYVSGQVTWADNVLNIHAVDAVHFLDNTELPASIAAFGSQVRVLQAAAEYMLGLAGVTAETNIYTGSDYARGGFALSRGVPVREYFRFFNWAVNNPTRSFWYVDAGRPKLNINAAPTSAAWTIEEEDCADLQKNTEPKISKVTISYNQTEWGQTVTVGSLDWTKEGPAFLTLDDYVSDFSILSDIYSGASLLPLFKDGESYANNSIFITVTGDWGAIDFEKLYSSDTPEDAMIGQRGGSSGPTVRPYCQVIPWSNTAATNWQKMIDWGKITADQTSYNQDLAGTKYQKIPTTYVYDDGAGGQAIEVSIDDFLGTIYRTYYDVLFPNETAQRLTEISNITYSFTWKGDPRMQPRDVVEWERLDGTPETITLENITLTHEKGGTVAEITARKGIV